MAPRRDPQLGLGRAIRKLRLDAGMTQEAVARAAGLHLTYISQLEAGKRNPSWANVKRLADAFGISMRDLAGLAEEMESEQPSLT